MVMWEQAGARVTLSFADGSGPHRIEVKVVREVQGQRARRSIVINKQAAQVQKLAGRVPVVLFHPEEMTLIRGPGEPRRRLINNLMAQLSPQFHGSLSGYGRVVEQRNQLLKRIADESEPLASLDWWTAEVGRRGGEIMGMRHELIERLAPVVTRRHADLAPGEELELRYRPSVAVAEASSQVCAAAIVAELGRRRHEELARGQTVAGPHRDDLEFVLGRMPAAAHASQGQQRTAILAFKLAEIELLGGDREPPVLLLDDVMSELDAPRREHLMARVEQSPQTVITAAEERYFPAEFKRRIATWRVEAGKIMPEGRQ